MPADHRFVAVHSRPAGTRLTSDARRALPATGSIRVDLIDTFRIQIRERVEFAAGQLIHILEFRRLFLDAFHLARGIVGVEIASGRGLRALRDGSGWNESPKHHC